MKLMREFVSKVLE